MAVTGTPVATWYKETGLESIGNFVHLFTTVEGISRSFDLAG